ncbi:TIGR02281 family clan AA aspartic protease [Novosphingobium sp. Chol11]|uniref:retropepsin-like aspartic protease family protein n=1 Tax=Novosphingobium sp. Chol11 TaxID=1385763 RepID=UPI0025F5FF2E|nr:TIGR02281 family clan AA aspartic protease [Novosphingobium sp. Chol11]
MLRFLIFAWVVIGLAALVGPLLDANPARAPGIKASVGTAAKSARSEEPGTVSRGDVTVIRRDSTGQFHLDVDVGGAQITFLIDTGADVVALTEDDAQALGITPDADSFRPILQTASGTGMGAPVQLERMSIAGRELDNVQAVVVPDLPVSLLGQSALRRLGSVTLQGDRLIIEG